MIRILALGGLAAATLLVPAQLNAQGGFAGEPVPTAMDDEMDSTLPINTGYHGGFGGGAWHPDAWHSGDIGGTWHGDGWHAGGAYAGGFHGPSVVNHYYSGGCTQCSGAPNATALQSAFDETLPVPSDTGSLTTRPPAACGEAGGGDVDCGEGLLHPYYGNNGVYYKNEATN
jgi:hypothetical protein